MTRPCFGQGHWPAPAHMPCVHEVRWGLEQPEGILPRPREAELRGVLEAAWALLLLSVHPKSQATGSNRAVPFLLGCNWMPACRNAEPNYPSSDGN